MTEGGPDTPYCGQGETLLDETGWREEAEGVIHDIAAYVQVSQILVYHFLYNSITFILVDRYLWLIAGHKLPDLPEPGHQGGGELHHLPQRAGIQCCGARAGPGRAGDRAGVRDTVRLAGQSQPSLPPGIRE